MAETGAPPGPVLTQSAIPTWGPRSLTGTAATGEAGSPPGPVSTQSFIPTWAVRA
jgi:hypothetical protein